MESCLRYLLLVGAVLAVGSSTERHPRSLGHGPGLFVPAGPSAPTGSIPKFPPGPLPELVAGQLSPREHPVITLPSYPQTLLRTKVLPHHVPPRTVRIINTVAVPYPVPHPVRHEVAVPIAKPYPVPVPVPSSSYGAPGGGSGHGETSAKYKQSMGHAEITQAVFKGSEGTQHYENGDLALPPGGGIFGGGSSAPSSDDGGNGYVNGYGNEGSEGVSGYGNGNSEEVSGFGNGGLTGAQDGTNYAPEYSGGGYGSSEPHLAVPLQPSGGSGGDDYSQGGPSPIGAINAAFANHASENYQGGDAEGHGQGHTGAYANIAAVTAGEAYANYDQNRGSGGRDGYGNSGVSASGNGGDHYGSSSETKQAVDAEQGNDNNNNGYEEREDLKKRSQHSGSPHNHKTIVTIEKAIDAGSYVHTSYSGDNRIHK